MATCLSARRRSRKSECWSVFCWDARKASRVGSWAGADGGAVGAGAESRLWVCMEMRMAA